MALLPKTLMRRPSSTLSAVDARGVDARGGDADATSLARLKIRPGGATLTPKAPVRFTLGPAPEEGSVLSMSCRPHDNLLAETQAFISAYATARYLRSVAPSMSLAAYELFGNALTYGTFSEEVSFQIVEASGAAGVRVSNHTAPIRVEMLRAHLERLERDPEATYLDEMRRSLARGTAQPMLGLARVVHEAKLELEAYVRGSLVTVIARVPL
jgi:hypothetical protein